jgi:hypothetical protein
LYATHCLLFLFTLVALVRPLRSIRADQEQAERLRSEIERTRALVEKLQTEPVVFQVTAALPWRPACAMPRTA